MYFVVENPTSIVFNNKKGNIPGNCKQSPNSRYPVTDRYTQKILKKWQTLGLPVSFKLNIQGWLFFKFKLEIKNITRHEIIRRKVFVIY